MLDPTASLDSFAHGNPPVRSLTPDGQRVASFIKSLADVRQQAAATAAFSRLHLQIADTMAVDTYNGVMGGNGPPRYDYHSGEYFDYGQATTGGVKICTDDSLLVAKGHR